MAGIITYKTYAFKDKDPVIDKLRTLVQDEAKKSKTTEKEVCHKVCLDSGMSETTPDNWFNGDTRRPQHATVMAFAGALGYEQKFVRIKK